MAFAVKKYLWAMMRSVIQVQMDVYVEDAATCISCTIKGAQSFHSGLRGCFVEVVK